MPRASQYRTRAPGDLVRLGERHPPPDQPVGDVGGQREAPRGQLGHPVGVERQGGHHARRPPAAARAAGRGRRRPAPCPPAGRGCRPAAGPCSVASRPVRLPISRPALPRASSATSGFFFCGMIDDPVDQASSSVAKPNSTVHHRMTSSAEPRQVDPDLGQHVRRLGDEVAGGRAVDRVGHASRRSPARRATELGVEPERRAGQRRRAVGRHRQPAVEVARAGRTSRSSGQAWASRWWDSSTGCADCRWVRPGIGDAEVALGLRARAPRPRRSDLGDHPRARRAGSSRIRVAIWSLRERPARSRPPSSAPTRSIRPRSSAPWTSSSVGRRDEGAGGHVGVQRVEPGEHAGELVVGQQARRGAAPGRGRASRRGRAGREPPVELRRLG